MSNLFLKEAIPVTEQNWADDTQPVVSVFNWSYNHVNFIRQSIESILEQKTTFPIEIIIHDDASNDGTIEIIREYESKYPRLFRNIIQKENQWSQGKSVMDSLFKNPRGKYIALTHGDDYWTDPYKLQKQVDFLEENPEYILCYHAVKVLTTDGELKDDFLEKKIIKSESSGYDLGVWGNFMHTCTVVFRNNNMYIPKNIPLSGVGDYYLWVFLSQFGKISRLQDIMAVYRQGVGVFSTQNKDVQQAIIIQTLHNLCNSLSDPTLIQIIKHRIANFKFEQLPSQVKKLDNLNRVYDYDKLASHVSMGVLFRAVFQKVKMLLSKIFFL